MADVADPPVLHGDGIVLRALRPADADAWKAGEDDEQRRWFEMPGPAPIENVVAAIERWQASWRDGGPVFHWGIWLPGDDHGSGSDTGSGERLAGGVELRVRNEDGKANVSYLVFPDARRQGVAGKAVRLATGWAFAHLGVPAAVAVIHPDNEASRATARRAGFAEDGWAADWEYGETGPMLRYVLTRA